MNRREELGILQNPYISIGTMTMVTPFTGPISALDWQRVHWPPCPGCGRVVHVEMTPVTGFASRYPRFVPGRWHCPGPCGNTP